MNRIKTLFRKTLTNQNGFGKLLPIACCLLSATLLISCQPVGQNAQQYNTLNVVNTDVIDEHSVPIFPKKAALTTDTARRFAIDLPMRCTVDWDNQRVVANLPEQPIEIVNVSLGDDLPAFNVENFAFKKMSVSAVITKLLDGTNITVVPDDEITDKISGEIQSGALSDALSLITKLGHAYYSYDADLRELHLSRRAKWIMKMPGDNNVIMALTDAMRGAEIRNILVNWDDKTMQFSGNWQTEKQVQQIITDLGAQKYILAWDTDVYRVYPRTDNPIIWMNMLPALGANNVKMSIPGVVGRALVVSPEINTKTLQQFLATSANVVLISQGTFSIPNGWQTRFDIGQCSREDRLETDLIVGATAKFHKMAGMDKIDATIELRTQNGEIANYDIPSDVGDNYVIIGIPTHSFVTTPETLISPFAELVVFMSPRLIRIMPADGAADSAPLSGDALREYLNN